MIALAAAGPEHLIPLGAAFGVVHGIVFPALMALVLGESAREERPRLLAFANGAINLGITGLGAIGAIADRVGYPSVFFVTGAITTATAALLLLPQQAVELALPLHRLSDQLGHVQDLDALARVPVLDAVPQHDRAERAGGGDRLGAGREDLVRAVVVHARADLLFHPHPPAAGAAAEPVLACCAAARRGRRRPRAARPARRAGRRTRRSSARGSRGRGR